MATLNKTVGGAAGFPASAIGKIGVIENIVDYAESPSGATDIVQVLNVPAGAVVLLAGAEVLRAEGGTAAGTLGDGADPDGYRTTLNANAAVGTTVVSSPVALTEGAPNTVTGYTGGKHYPAADTIDHVTTNALVAAKIRYFAVVANVSGT